MYYFFSTNKKKLDNGKTITYKLKFIDSFRFMSRKLSDLADNLPEIKKKKSKGCKQRRKIKSVCDFIGLKIINYVTNAKNVKNNG